jgi:hypothetical protein
MESDARPQRAPLFQVGDRVTVVGPGTRKGAEGLVVRVVEGSLDFVHRYHVQFGDGTTTRYFGFELELGWAEWSKLG